LNLVLISKLVNRHVFAKTIFQIIAFTLVCVPCTILGIFIFGITQHLFGLLFSIALSGAIVTGALLVLCHVFCLVKFDMLRIALKRN